MILIFVYYFLIAGVFTFGKQVVVYAQPFFLTFIRMFFAGILILIFQKLFHPKELYFSRKHFFPLIGFATGTFILDSGRLFGLVYLPSTHAALVATTVPLIAALLSSFAHEHLSKKRIIILCFGVCSILPIIVDNMIHAQKIGMANNVIFGYFIMFVAMVGFVFASIFTRRLTYEFGYPVLTAVGCALTGAGIMGLCASLCFEVWNPMPIIYEWKVIVLIVYLFVTHNLIAYPLHTYVLKYYPTTLVSFCSLTISLFTVLLRFLFFNESVHIVFIISFILLSISLYFFHKKSNDMVRV